MAFYTHYTGGFRSHAGIDYEVSIDGRTTQPWVRQLVFDTDAPVTIERGGEDNLFAPILSISSELVLLAEYADQYTHLMSAPEQSYRVTIMRGAGKEIVFVGWIESGLSEEAFDRPPYEVCLTAADGLASLQDYPCLLPYSDKHSGRMILSLSSLIEHCLRTAGDHIPSAPAIIISRLRSAASSELERLHVDVRAMLFDENGIRTDESAHDTLSTVLASLGMRVYQHRGGWVIDRPADLLHKTAKPINSLTMPYLAPRFISATTVSTLPAYGSIVANLNTEKRDNFLRSRMQVGDKVTAQSFDAPYDEWRYCELGNNIFTPSLERKDGFDVLMTRQGETPWVAPSVAYFAKFKVGDLLQWRNSAVLKVSYKLALFSGQSDQDVYVDHRIVLLENNTPRYIAIYAALKNDGLARSKYKRFLGYQRVSGSLIGDPSLSRSYGEVVKEDNVSLHRASDISMTIYCSEIAPDDFGKINGIGIIISPTAYLAYENEKEKKKHGENYRPEVGAVRQCSNIARLGGLKISAEQYKEYDLDDAITVMLDQNYQRRADEIDIRLRTLEAQDTAVSALYPSADSDDPVSEIFTVDADGTTREICLEQLAAEDRFPLYSTKRTSVSGLLNKAELSPLFQPYTLSTEPGKYYMLTDETANLLDDSAEITLHEIIQPTKMEVEWRR